MVTSITYGRLYNLGNYENEKIEVTVSVVDDDVSSAMAVAYDTVEMEHATLIAARKAPQSTTPATTKQRNYIAMLQNDIGWHSEQLAQYAKEQRIDLVSMTSNEASILIYGMKRLAQESIPF